MLRVEFHTSVAEPQALACRLLRRAARQGVRVAVSAPGAVLQSLDRLLWTFDERDFVPHVRTAGAPPGLLERTPIWLLDATPALALPAVLVNLGSDVAEPWPGLERVIEIVGAEAGEAEAGRARWRAYKAAGCTLTHHAAA